MWLDLVALPILAACVGLGALRGGLVTGLSLFGLGAAYAGAIAVAPRVGPALGRSLGLPEILGVLIAGAALFLAIYATCGGVTRALARRGRGRRRSPRDRFLGGALGGLRGALVVLLLSWLALWVEALRATGSAAPLPELGPSRAAAVTESVVEAGVGVALAQERAPTRRVVASLVARPDRALVGLQAVLENPRVEELRADSLFWTYVEHGSIDTALNRWSFVQLGRDDALRAQLADIGLIEPAAAADAGVFREAVADVLRQLGPRLEGLRDDPELRELLDDPDLTAMLRSGDTVRLVRHEGFRRLVARVAQAPSP